MQISDSSLLNRLSYTQSSWVLPEVAKLFSNSVWLRYSTFQWGW